MVNYFADNLQISERFSKKTSTPHWNVETYKEGFEFIVSILQIQVTCKVD